MNRRAMLSLPLFALFAAPALAQMSHGSDADHSAHTHVDAGDFVLHDPRIFAVSAAAPTAAGFLVIENLSGRDDRLVGIETPMAKRAELHSSTTDDAGVTRMRRFDGGVSIADGGRHVFEPRADHLMLMGVTGPLEDGATVPITLVFEHAGRVEVQFPVTHTPQMPGGHDDHTGHMKHGDG